MYALGIMHKQTCAYICTENKVQTSAYLCRAEKCAKLCSHFPDTGGEMPLQGLLVVSVFNSFDYLI
jgi:uncharacterized Fe-S radical SAM superfamily protein PflX